MSDSQQFPLPFCNVRWLEFKPVAERAVNIWQNVKKVLFHWEKLIKSINQMVNAIILLCHLLMRSLLY